MISKIFDSFFFFQFYQKEREIEKKKLCKKMGVKWKTKRIENAKKPKTKNKKRKEKNKNTGHARGDSYSAYSQTMSERGHGRTTSGFALGSQGGDNVFGVRHMKMLNEIKKEKESTNAGGVSTVDERKEEEIEDVERQHAKSEEEKKEEAELDAKLKREEELEAKKRERRRLQQLQRASLFFSLVFLVVFFFFVFVFVFAF